MSIWGRILSGASALMTGPIGALLGALGSHGDSRGGEQSREGAASGDTATGDTEDGTQSIVFTIGVIVLSAKMAKVDGIVKRAEVDAFKRLFEVDPAELENVGRIYNLARRDAAGFEIYARQIAGLFGERHPVLEELLDSLLLIAESDGDLHAAEVGYLHAIGRIFGFEEADVDRLFAGRRIAQGDPFCDPYQVLGLPCGAAEDIVKDAYRRLARENHPDRLIAQGLPPEFVAVATEKMATINAAYDRIMKQGAGAGALAL